MIKKLNTPYIFQYSLSALILSVKTIRFRTVYIYGEIIINSAYIYCINLLPKRFRLSAQSEVYKLKKK